MEEHFKTGVGGLVGREQRVRSHGKCGQAKFGAFEPLGVLAGKSAPFHRSDLLKRLFIFDCSLGSVLRSEDAPDYVSDGLKQPYFIPQIEQLQHDLT